MVGLKRYWYKFLNWVVPNRRERLLKKIMEFDEVNELYYDLFENKNDEAK